MLLDDASISASPFVIAASFTNMGCESFELSDAFWRGEPLVKDWSCFDDALVFYDEASTDFCSSDDVKAIYEFGGVHFVFSIKSFTAASPRGGERASRAL